MIEQHGQTNFSIVNRLREFRQWISDRLFFDPLDKKSRKELDKHRRDFYRDVIVQRIQHSSLASHCKLPRASLKIFDQTLPSRFFCRLENITSYTASNFDAKTDPLVRTAVEVYKNSLIQPEDTYLFRYCQNFQPSDYAEVFKVHGSPTLRSLSQYSDFFPWRDKQPKINRTAGLFGPIHLTAIEHRLLRIRNLIRSIREFSFVHGNGGGIGGFILKSHDSWRFVVTAGHHRIAVLMALKEMGEPNISEVVVELSSHGRRKGGYSTEVTALFDEANSTHWPGVLSGFIPQIEAIRMFRRYFD